jgi:thiol-disulfide isomerase/thioredoxin
MTVRFILFGVLFWSGLSIRLEADDAPPAAAAEQEPLTTEAQAAVDELRGSLPPDSEAIAMLEHILNGSRLGADDGWFPLAKSQTRFRWEDVSASYDADGDGSVAAKEFLGSEADYARLDRDGDEQLTASDFDWSEHSLTSTPGFTMFFMADRDANGKVTEQEFTELFKMLGAEQGGYLAIDDLRDQFPATPPPPRANANRPDKPSRSTLILGLKNQEIGSLQSGPKLNELAPDFTLITLQGEPVTLSKEIGDKPVVLIFGNFTCGPFRSQAGNIEKLYQRYRDRFKFFLVYVREAHPKESWWMMSNQRAGIDIAQPKDFSGRREIAGACQRHLELDIPFLIDTIDDQVGSQYSGMPNRLYLIDQQGRIAFKNSRGPFGFHPRQLEQAMILLSATSEKSDGKSSEK